MSHGPAKATPPPRRALIFIVATVFLDTMGFGLFIPVLPKMLTSLAGVSVSEGAAIGGWLVMSYALAQFLFAPLIGNLSDRFGRRPVLLLSMAGFSVNYLIAAFAPTVAILFIGRIIAGIFGASHTTAYAYIADVTPPEKRAENFGLIGVAFGLGFVFGPAIGGLIGANDYRIPFFAAAGLAGINFLMGLFILPESLPPERRRPFEWARATPLGSLRQLKRLGGPLILLALVIFLWQLSIQAQHSIWPYYTSYRFGWTPFEIGLSLTLVGVLAIFVNGVLVKRAVARLGEWRTSLIGAGAGALAFTLYGLATSPGMLITGILVGALGGLTFPALQAMITAETPANEQGELQGAIAALSSLTIILGPPVMSQSFAWGTRDGSALHLPGAPFFLATLLAISAVLVLLRQRSLHPTPAEAV